MSNPNNSIKNVTTTLLVIGIFAIGLYLRIEMTDKTVVETPIRADATEYVLYAYNMAKYGVYSQQRPDRVDDGVPHPDAYRTPGYSLFLLPFLKIYHLPKMVRVVVLAQAIISSLTILAAFIFFRSFLSRPWALAAGFLVAISPHLVAFNIYILTESLFTFFLVLLSWSISVVAKNKRPLPALLAGIFLGISLLIRPTMLYFIAFLIPAFFVFFQKKRALGLALCLIIGFSATYGPWVLRNALVNPSKSKLAYATVHKGMYPDLIYNNDSKTYGSPNRFDPTWNQRRDMTSVLKEIVHRFKDDPQKYARWYIFGKPVMFFSWDIIVGMGDVFIYPVFTSPYHSASGFFGWTHRLMKSIHGKITVFALLTAIFLWLPMAKKLITERGLIPARFASLLILYFILVHIIGTPLPRYSVPLRPFTYGLSILGIYLIIKASAPYLPMLSAKRNDSYETDHSNSMF
jgi:4-amino-4-deoxy-L-arabinose transferase-like glycosyltransferase